MDKITDNQIYKLVGEEVFKSEYSPGPMARAVADASGDRASIQSLYVRYRFEELKQQIEKEQLAAAEYECKQFEEKKASARINGLFACPICGYYGKPTVKSRGFRWTYAMVALPLLCYYVIPGVVYFVVYLIWAKSGRFYSCPQCQYPLDKSEIPEDAQQSVAP